MSINEKEIYVNIYHYITKELDAWYDDSIFTKNSIKELGKLYYNRILQKVENSNTDLLNKVIKDMIKESSQNDYYTSLCKILYFKNLPKTVLNDVERKYNEIFIDKYNAVIHSYQIELSKINTNLLEIKSDIDKIKNTPPTYSFMRDISTDEKKIYELNSKCNCLRSRKEMLKFITNYVTSQLSEFCDIQNPHSIEKAKKCETIKLCKEISYNIDSLFSPYLEYINILEDDLNRPYALFYKVKIFIILEDANKQLWHSQYKKSQSELINQYKEYTKKIPKIDDLHSYKTNNITLYNNALEELISNYDILKSLQDMLTSSICLRSRKNILLKALELYKLGEFEVFNNIIPIQIEGMFEDYLLDSTIFIRFSKMDIYLNAVLKDKIRHLQEIKDNIIYPEVVEYFMYYFNNMIRNKVAHGKYKGNQNQKIIDEIFSKELLLDLGILIHMLSRKSETEKMYRFIHSYKKYYVNLDNHQLFNSLFNDITGRKIIAEYDSIENFRPLQITYWLINPYYEKIYENINSKDELLQLRNKFLSKEFWKYVLEELNLFLEEDSGYLLKINEEFISIVNGLFKCSISSDVKQILGKVHATLSKIKDTHH